VSIESHDERMNRFRPKSYAVRREWAEQHLWLSACLFATIMSTFFLLLGLLTKPSVGLRLRVAVGLTTWPIMVLMTVVATKRHWGERSDPELEPSKVRRLWDDASDRALFVFWLLGLAGVVVWPIQFATGSATKLGAVIGIIASSLLAVGVWRERRRRRTHSPGRR
jgi:hypothetical protein